MYKSEHRKKHLNKKRFLIYIILSISFISSIIFVLYPTHTIVKKSEPIPLFNAGDHVDWDGLSAYVISKCDYSEYIIHRVQYQDPRKKFSVSEKELKQYVQPYNKDSAIISLLQEIKNKPVQNTTIIYKVYKYRKH